MRVHTLAWLPTLIPSAARLLAVALLLASLLLANLLIANRASAQTPATDFNVTELSRVDENAYYSDVWGYLAPDGREYALMGANAATCIADVTDPRNPVVVAQIPGTSCLWREIQSRGQYVYVVNDCSSGVQVIDMSDPAHPALINEFEKPFLKNVHTLRIDQQTGKLYTCGTDKGLVIYDLAADPVNPPRITTWNGAGVVGAVSGYSHDCFVRDGVAHVAMINDGIYALLDVSNLPAIAVIGQVTTGKKFAHSMWLTDDSHYAIVADEKAGIHNLELYDISDMAHPTLVKDLSQGTTGTPHNPFMRGDILHLSYYTTGYVAIDLSNPLAPVTLGKHFTAYNPPPLGILIGAWGVYPYQPSGIVYVSDIRNGLYVLRLNQNCPPDPGGQSTLCSVWPAHVTAGVAQPTVLLQGNGMSGALAVHAGGETLLPGQFEVIDDQTVAFALTAPPGAGLLPLWVETTAGTTGEVYLPVHQAGAPQLASGEPVQEVGDELLHTLDSDPGDLQFLGFSLAPQPSVAPGKVAFDIGAGFTNLFLLAPLLADGAGQTVLSLAQVPASAAGLTVFWQFAALDGSQTLPAPVSNVTVTQFDAD